MYNAQIRSLDGFDAVPALVLVLVLVLVLCLGAGSEMTVGPSGRMNSDHVG